MPSSLLSPHGKGNVASRRSRSAAAPSRSGTACGSPPASFSQTPASQLSRPSGAAVRHLSVDPSSPSGSLPSPRTPLTPRAPSLVTETIDYFLLMFPNLAPQVVSDVVKQHPTLEKDALEEDLVAMGGVHAFEAIHDDTEFDGVMFDEMQQFIMNCNEHQVTVVGYVQRGEKFDPALLRAIEADITKAEHLLATKGTKIAELPLVKDGLKIAINEGRTLLLSWEALMDATRALAQQEERRRPSEVPVEADGEDPLLMTLKSFGHCSESESEEEVLPAGGSLFRSRVLTTDERELYVSQRNRLDLDRTEIERLRRELREKERMIQSLRREVDTLKGDASAGALCMKRDVSTSPLEHYIEQKAPLAGAALSVTADEHAQKEVRRLSTENAFLRGVLKNHAFKTRQTVYRLRESLGEIRSAIGGEQKCMLADFQTCIAALDRIKQASVFSDQMERLYRNEVAMRKQYQEMLHDLRGNIRVFCRIRKLDKDTATKSKGRCTIYSQADPEAVEVHDVLRPKRGKKRFQFNKVFTESATQSDVFASFEPMVDSTIEGYNVCLFAYGQTGSGKSYTIMGSTRDESFPLYSKHKGMFERSAERIFELLAAKKAEGETCNVYFSALEVHCERIVDLLLAKQPSKPADYRVKTGPYAVGSATLNGTYVEDLIRVKVSNPAEVMKHMNQARQNRKESKRTSASSRLSRSHMIVTMYICLHNKQSGISTYSIFNMVDLAGSERQRTDLSDRSASEETRRINMSLMTLGVVFRAIQQDDPHLKFRDSKLTHVLQDCLTGLSKVAMVAACSPAEADAVDTKNTMDMASRAMKCALGAAARNRSKE